MAKGLRTGPVAQPAGRQQSSQVQIVSRQGPLPAPEELLAYNQLIPGSAERIIAMAEREQAVRHNLEDMAQRADIRHRDEVLKAQRDNARGIFVSDGLGQVLGWVLATVCAGLAAYTALQGVHPAIPIAFLTLPIASVIRALRSRNDGKK